MMSAQCEVTAKQASGAQGAALAAVVGVLVEGPVMLSVVHMVNASKGWYERGAGVSDYQGADQCNICTCQKAVIPERFYRESSIHRPCPEHPMRPLTRTGTF